MRACRSMTPTVLLLLLSILTVQARGCNPLDKATVRNFQDRISNENTTGFPQVFPKDYAVPRHFNPSTQCDSQSDKCCMFSEALLLSYSWTRLLQHLERIHLKRDFIANVKLQLDEISRDSFQQTPDPSVFPHVSSSPGALLGLTSSLLSKWLELNCPAGEHACDFIAPFAIEDGATEKEEGGNAAGKGTTKELLYEKEGEREKRWVTVIPNNGDTGSFTSLGILLCALSSLRMIMDIVF